VAARTEKQFPRELCDGRTPGGGGPAADAGGNDDLRNDTVAAATKLQATLAIRGPGDVQRAIDWLNTITALTGGLLIAAASLAVFASILARALTGRSLYGDMEVVQIATAVGASLFLPYAQSSSVHVIVDVFTWWAGPRTLAALTRLGAVAMALIMAVLAWRTAAGAVGMWQAREQSIMLGVPTWICYAALVPGLALAALVALLQAVAPLAHKSEGSTP
jgi:TRAP-type C4-dicarboxylate transport system permease small subunit